MTGTSEHKPAPFHQQGKRLSVEAKAWFYEEVKKGKNPYRTADILGVGRGTARRLIKQMNEAYGGTTPLETARKISLDSGPDGGYPDPKISLDQLVHPQAIQAWNEFGYWRNLLLGRRHIAWQIEMVQILMSWMESGQQVAGTDESEVIKGIINTPPGGGKTTTITHDFPGWLITRNRDIRVALGSRTIGQSGKYTRRLRSTLERNVLLNIYFGRFKPLEPEEWRSDRFIVDGVVGHEATMDYKIALAGFDPTSPEIKARLKNPEDDIHSILEAIKHAYLTGEKESTVASLSQDMGFLGGRFDVNLWDDLADKNNSKTSQQRDDTAEWWFSEAESRCEPGGLIALIGTRFGKFDIYNHCKNLTYQTDDSADEATLDMVTSTFTEEEMQQVREDLEKELVDKYGQNYSDLSTPDVRGGMRKSRKVYHYYKFPAHDETKCDNPASMKNSDHIKCILDPKRFSYTHLRKVQASDPRKYNLTYQQSDEDTSENLVQKIWLTGGVDDEGIIYPGCYDYNRRLLDIPEDLKREDCFSIATLDPSAQNFWAFQWWFYDQKNDVDYLMDILRVRISSGTFLDYDIRKRSFKGIAEDWQIRSQNMGWPISLWIIEQNAAQRYLFQYNWVQTWMKLHHVTIKGHQTGRNKADEELGVESIAPRFRRGRVNLPFHDDDLTTKVRVNEFAKELTEWPDSQTDDEVMSYWFHHANRQIYPESMKVGTPSSTGHVYKDSMPDYVTGKKPPRVEHMHEGHSANQLRRRLRKSG